MKNPKHEPIKIKGGEIRCLCGWSYYEQDTGFPTRRLQDRLLDFFLDHKEDMEEMGQ